MADERYLSPEKQPVFALQCKESFEKLTEKEKTYAHYISQASWHGSLICLHQTSEESPVLFYIFQKLFHSDKPQQLKEKALANGVSEEEFEHFLQFVAAFYGNMGNYLSFGDTKFVPRSSLESFRKIIESSSSKSKDELLQLFNQYKDRIFSLAPEVLSLGLEEKGISTYYSPNIKVKDVEKVSRFMQQKNISPYNTRLWKHSNAEFELKIASGDKKPSESFQFEDVKITISYGDHSKYLEKVAENLEKACDFAANPNQENMMKKYAQHFRGGSIEDHKDAQRYWIKDIGPVVETNIGFIESYRDPQGERGEFEGFVAIVNKDMSKKFSKLVESAETFIPTLPWPKEFEKDKFLRPDFTSLEVLSFASSGVPAGINIPNYDDIRQTEGFKNVSLGNVLAARSKEPIDFIQESDQELYDKYETKSFEVQVGIHELLGHGTGKLLSINESGEFNFPKDLINPLTGDKIKSWYLPGETWDSKFQSVASTMEECRAECAGLYLCTNSELLNIFGFTGQEAEDVYFINWLIMARAGLRALEFFSPENNKWGQAHMQARFAILRVMLEAGEGLVEVKHTEDDVFVVLDRKKVASVGMKAVGNFLQKLQIYKATADVEQGTKFYSGYTDINEYWLQIRKLVLSKRKPRRVFVQPHTSLVDKQVKLQEFEPTPEGVIESFVTRFPELSSYQDF